jgi:N-acetyl-gamma-glutamylphosphate reductase
MSVFLPGALPSTGRLRRVLIAKFDNLGKGAAGAAVQNLMLMLGR